MEDRWLSVDEIGNYLGVSRDTIYNWISNRGMPAFRVGRLWKSKRSYVDAWIQAGGGAQKKAARGRQKETERRRAKEEPGQSAPHRSADEDRPATGRKKDKPS